MKIIYLHKMDLPNDRAYSLQIINTCWNLAYQGCEVELIIRQMKKEFKECLDFYGLGPLPKFKILELKGRKSKFRGLSFLLFLVALSLKIRREKKEIYFYTRQQEIARTLSNLRWLHRKPVIIELHSILYYACLEEVERKFRTLKEKNRYLQKVRKLEEFLYNKVNGIVCTTNGIKNILTSEFKSCIPIQVIPNGVWLKDVGKIERKNTERRDVCYIGQLYPWKGVDVLIGSLKYLPDVQLLIVGGNKPQDMSRIKNLAIELTVEDRVKFEGYVSPREVRNYLSKAQIGVLPIPNMFYTRNFLCPLKLLEYMAHRIPVIVSDLPCIREIIEDDYTGVLVKPGDAKDLAEGIKKILNNDNFAKEISQNAYKQVKEFSWEKRSKKIIRFIIGLNKN